jgi:hypothetical protein
MKAGRGFLPLSLQYQTAFVGLRKSWLRLIGGGRASLAGLKDEPTLETWAQ